MVDDLLAGAHVPENASSPAALVVPHAGYVYSGPVAATAYSRLFGTAASISRVVAFGPVHYVPVRGAAVPAALAWATPLGEVPIEEPSANGPWRAERRSTTARMRPSTRSRSSSRSCSGSSPRGSVSCPSPSRSCRPGKQPISSTRSSARPGTLVLVSTDLSHYHDLATARRLDRRTAQAVVARNAAALGEGDACGIFALRGLVELARRKQLPIDLLDLRTSADTAGDPERVVGYGAFAVGAPRGASRACQWNPKTLRESLINLF